MSSANSDSLLPFQFGRVLFCCCLVALGRTSILCWIKGVRVGSLSCSRFSRKHSAFHCWAWFHCGLVIHTIMLRHVPPRLPLLRVFIIMDVEFHQMFFWINWCPCDFYPLLCQCVSRRLIWGCWATVAPLEGTHFFLVWDLPVLLGSVCSYFVEYFCIWASQGYWPARLFSGGALLWF